MVDLRAKVGFAADEIIRVEAINSLRAELAKLGEA